MSVNKSSFEHQARAASSAASAEHIHDCYVCRSPARVDDVGVHDFVVGCSRNRGFQYPCDSKRSVSETRAAAVSDWNSFCENESKGAFYVASRASNPERSAMWRRLRDELNLKITSTWIDVILCSPAVESHLLWTAIVDEIKSCDCLVLYVELEDFPLKGALVEAGMALVLGKPVRIVTNGLEADIETLARLLGSWAFHPSVTFFDTVENALSTPLN